MKKLNITFCSFPDFSSNAKPMYEYMKSKYNDTMNFAWIVRTNEMLEKLKKDGIKSYILYSDGYYSYMKKSNIIFSTHGDLIYDKPEGSLYIELWHGISSKHVGNLSNNVSLTDEKWYKTLKSKIDYFIVPSELWRIIFSTRFNVNYNRTLSLGYPKLDYFLQNNPKQNLEKILNININNYNKIIYYMPTFRKGCNRESDSTINIDNIFNLDNYDENKLKEYLNKNNYLLCIKKHPSEETNVNYIENDNIKVINEDMLLDNKITINEIMNAADLMITDYSSLGIEFIFLDKPVVYLTKDIEEYREKRGITFDNVDFWMPGYQVKKIDELLNSINNCFKDDYKYRKVAREKKKLWFGNLGDGGCAQICNYFFNDNGQLNNDIKYYVDEEERLEKQIKILNENTLEKENIIEGKNYIISEKEKELELIKNSKGWKLLEKLRKIRK